MHTFDFFTEFTSKATRAWTLGSFVSPDRPKSVLATRKHVIHDLSFHVSLAPVPYSTPSAPTSCIPRRSSNQSAVDMPLELIISIIEAASDQGVLDIALLKSCSLVCKAWSLSAQKLLFRSVTLRTQKSFQSFMKAVDCSSEHAVVLKNAVRRLQVVVDYNQPGYIHQHDFAQVVTMCPNLQELDLAIYALTEGSKPNSSSADDQQRHAPSFDAKTLSLLRSASPIKSLSFSNWTENQQCIFQLLNVWPSIRSLSMSGTSPQLPSHTNFFDSPLEELRINFQTPPSMEFMNWLLHHSKGSLRKLTFERDPCPDLFESLMASHGDTLRSLSIPSCTSAEQARIIERSCSDGRLKFMRMDQPQVNPLAYKSLPVSISHLALGVDRDTPLQPLIDLVKARSELETITVRLWNGGSNHRLLSALKIACAYRGVDLRTTTDAREYRMMITC